MFSKTACMFSQACGSDYPGGSAFHSSMEAARIFFWTISSAEARVST